MIIGKIKTIDFILGNSELLCFVSDAAEFVQISRADDIRPTVHLYYFEQSKTIHRSWFTPNCLPLRKGVEVKFILR